MKPGRTLLSAVLAASIAFAAAEFARVGSPSQANASTLSMKRAEFVTDPVLTMPPRPRIFADGPLCRLAMERADDPDVRAALDGLLTHKREKVLKSISLSSRYVDHLSSILDRHGLPRELAFLCIIESGYSHKARSHAGAVGMWQFIRSTSARFGLRHDPWSDERLDFERSTEAAARYIQYLQTRFDDWDHILAAYNAGEGRVRSAVARAVRDGKDPHGSNLRLPRETRRYVPAFYAALLVATQPERYGLFPDYEPALDFYVLDLPGGIDIGDVAARLQVPVEDMRELNPSFLRGRVPPGTSYPVRVPCTVDMAEARKVVEGFQEIKWLTYKVKRGDTLWEISRKFGVSASIIDKGRGRRGVSRIYPGEVLVIPLAATGRI